jgi:membrane-associated phospholipid phosphatase
MTTICAVTSVLWIYYPRFRALYALVIATVAIGLIGADYHFLSDIIAGSLLGTITGSLAVALQEHAASRGPVRSLGE